MAIIVFQHGTHVAAGRLGVTLRDHGFSLDVRRLDLPRGQGGGVVPPDLDNVHGVISLGGEQNIGDDIPWLAEEEAFIKLAHDHQLPVIGICLGAQLIAKALGGDVGPMDKPEVGFHRVLLNPIGQIDTVLAGVPWDCPQFCSHGHEVKKLPAGATLLASSASCKVQAFRAGLRTFAFQYHFECDRPAIEQYCGGGCELTAKAGLTMEHLMQQADRDYGMYARVAERLCVNLATYAFPLQRRMTA